VKTPTRKTKHEKICDQLMALGEAPNDINHLVTWVKALINKCNRLEGKPIMYKL